MQIIGLHGIREKMYLHLDPDEQGIKENHCQVFQ